MIALGVDRAAGRWAWVLLDGPRVDAGVVDHLDALPGADGVGVDMPLAFPTDGGERASEVAARATLGPRSSTVFRTFPRWVYERPYDDDLRQECRLVLGRAPSAQSHGLSGPILEAVDAATRDWIEVHPELAFARRLGRPASKKRTWAGVSERLGVLESEGVVVPPIDVAPDDALDAAVVAVVVRAHADGLAVPLGVGDDRIWS